MLLLSWRRTGHLPSTFPPEKGAIWTWPDEMGKKKRVRREENEEVTERGKKKGTVMNRRGREESQAQKMVETEPESSDQESDRQ